MEKSAVKDLLYGGLLELINNRSYYHTSMVGWEYNKFTEEGKTALDEFLRVMAVKMKEAEEAELNQRAKDMVMKTLKRDTTQ